MHQFTPITDYFIDCELVNFIIISEFLTDCLENYKQKLIPTRDHKYQQYQYILIYRISQCYHKSGAIHRDYFISMTLSQNTIIELCYFLLINHVTILLSMPSIKFCFKNKNRLVEYTTLFT